MTDHAPIDKPIREILETYNPLEIKDILLHGSWRKATKHKDWDKVLAYYTQNEVLIELEPDEFTDVVDSVAQRWTFDRTFPCEQDVATAVLNAELGEYTTKVTIYTPQGDKITFS